MGTSEMKQILEPEQSKTPTVIPSVDYKLMQEKINELLADNKALKLENNKLRKILANGEENKVEEMVNDFQREVKKALHDISAEVNQTDFSSRTIDSVNKLIDFLSYTEKELYSLVSVSNYGYFAYSEELRKCEKLKEDLLRVLNKSTFTSSVLPDSSERMVSVLTESLSNITDCLKEDE